MRAHANEQSLIELGKQESERSEGKETHKTNDGMQNEYETNERRIEKNKCLNCRNIVNPV